MRERLRDREPAARGVEIRSEQGERELVARPWLLAERVDRRGEPLVVMRLQLAGAPDRILDRVAVARKRKARLELDRAVEGGEEVAQRIGTARRPEADRRRDAPEQVVGGDQNAVAQETDKPQDALKAYAARPAGMLPVTLREGKKDGSLGMLAFGSPQRSTLFVWYRGEKAAKVKIALPPQFAGTQFNLTLFSPASNNPAKTGDATLRAWLTRDAGDLAFTLEKDSLVILTTK